MVNGKEYHIIKTINIMIGRSSRIDNRLQHSCMLHGHGLLALPCAGRHLAKPEPC